MSGAGGSGGAKKAVNGAVQFFKGLGHTATNLVHRRTDDEEEDPEYLKVRAGLGGVAAAGGGLRSGTCRRVPAYCCGVLGRPHPHQLAAALPAAAPMQLTSHLAPNLLCAPALPLPQVRAYIFELEKHLGEAHRQASRLVRHQAELGAATQEFGTAMITLGRFEEAVRAARRGAVGQEGSLPLLCCSLYPWLGAAVTPRLQT